MYTCFILTDDPDVRQIFNIFNNNPTPPFVELFATICDNINPQNNQHDSTSNVEDLLYEYESFGSKTMVVIVTPLSGWKDATCLFPTNQYSNEVCNLEMIRELVIST